MSKKIYCPKCEKRVFAWDEKCTSNMSAKCKRCNVIVTYIPMKNKTFISKVPQRNTSSGMRFF